MTNWSDLRTNSTFVVRYDNILAMSKALERQGLSVRIAHSLAGFAAADFSRARNAQLGRFTVDRLMVMVNSLGSRVDVKVRIRRVCAETPALAA